MKYCYLLFILLWGTQGFSQTDSAALVKYSPDFMMKEGVYLNFEQVKLNKPISKARLVVSAGYNDIEFFQKVFEKEIIEYFDHLGVKKDVKAKAIWGFNANGTIYINYNNEFNRIPVVGAICHFVANKTIYQDRPIRMYDYSYDYYDYNRRNQASTTELLQYLLNMETGEVLEFTQNAVEAMLMKDPQLYDEYVGLSKKKQKQLKFFYIRKYNEKHPLYFPVN
jgi:hypothetical protein